LSEKNIEDFFEGYIKAKNGNLTFEDDVIYVTYPDKSKEEYTYRPAVGKQKKVPLIAPGSPAFQQVLRECQDNGVLCQIQLNPKECMKNEVKRHFKDAEFACINCDKVTVGEKEVSVCVNPQGCHHLINCGKISQIKIGKQEPTRFFQFKIFSSSASESQIITPAFSASSFACSEKSVVAKTITSLHW